MEANRINGIPIDQWLTLSGSQNISSGLSIDTLKAENLKFESLNDSNINGIYKLFGNGTIEINHPVQIQGRMSTSSIKFLSTAVIGNSTFDFGSIAKESVDKSIKQSLGKFAFLRNFLINLFCVF